MTAGDLLSATRRFWRVILVTTTFGGLLAGLITVALDSRRPIEASSTVRGVFVSPKAVADAMEQIRLDALFRTETRMFIPRDFGGSTVQTLTEVSKSPALLAQVADAAEISEVEAQEHIAITAVPGSDIMILSTYGDSATVSEQLNEQVAAVLEQRLGELFPTLTRRPVQVDRKTFSPTTSNLNSGVAWDIIAAQPENTLADISASESLGEELTFNTFDNTSVVTSNGVSQGQPPITSQPGTFEITANAPTTKSASEIAESAVSEVQALLDSLERPHPLAGSRFVVLSSSTVMPSGYMSRLGLNVVLGLLTGLIVALGYVFYRVSRETTIRRPEHILQLIDGPPIAVIGIPSQNNDETIKSAYRRLRTALVFGVPTARLVYLAAPTASVEAEQLPARLADSLVKAGHSVLLVDTEPGGNGLASIMPNMGTHVGGEPFKVPHLGFDALTLASPEGNPADYVSSRAFKILLESATESYDYVLCFGGATLRDSEALAVAAQCDATIVIVRQGYSTAVELATCLVQFMQVQAKVAGIVILDIPETDLDTWLVLPPAFLEPA